MPIDEFHSESRKFWDSSVANINGSKAATTVWRGQTKIIEVLNPFMGRFNHAHYPTGGGLDFLSVRPSSEAGCIEFSTGDRAADVVKPRSLTLEYIEAPGNSFLLLELDDLRPSGIYEIDKEDEGEDREIIRTREELVEIATGEYVDRSVWDQGFLGHDESGHGMPLPDTARLVTRWLSGKILIVAKGSLWNGVPATYDGRHNKMRAADIRSIIERSLAPRSS